MGSIQGSCMAVIDAAGDADVRQRAHALLAKIVQFEDVRRREARLTAPNGAVSLGPHLAETTPTPPSPDALYDGSGWLMPVLTNRTDVLAMCLRTIRAKSCSLSRPSGDEPGTLRAQADRYLWTEGLPALGEPTSSVGRAYHFARQGRPSGTCSPARTLSRQRIAPPSNASVFARRLPSVSLATCRLYGRRIRMSRPEGR